MKELLVVQSESVIIQIPRLSSVLVFLLKQCKKLSFLVISPTEETMQGIPDSFPNGKLKPIFSKRQSDKLLVISTGHVGHSPITFTSTRFDRLPSNSP